MADRPTPAVEERDMNVTEAPQVTTETSSTKHAEPVIAKGIKPSDTLGAIVSARPSLSRELEQRGFDYCCGGGRTLAEACADNGLDVESVIADLAQVAEDGTAAAWASMDADELVEHLVATHHRYLWDEMPRLSELTAKIASVHGERHPELAAVARCYEAIRADLSPHLLKEERVLFPMIAELATALRSTGIATAPSFHCGTLRNPISVMLREHDAVGALLGELRVLTNQFAVPADGCASYVACYGGLAELEADTHMHIHKENNLLFPMVVRMEQELAARFG
jgi:regulator of cell morphogenesis and NO signaling